MRMMNMKTNNLLSSPKEVSELETKPNNNPSPPNALEKQKDTVLKRSNAEQIHSQTFDFPKQKTKLTSKHSENPIPKIYLTENPTENDPNNKKQISKITDDSFIDELVEIEETVISKAMIFSQRNKFYNVSLNLEVCRQFRWKPRTMV